MIPAGRIAVDRKTLARKVYGISERQLDRRGCLTEPGAPNAISSPNVTAGHRLYDLAQWQAHAAGAPVPPLPADPDPLDLLDRGDVAAVLGIEAATWDEYVRDRKGPTADRTLAPPAGEIVCGVPHWHRRRIEAFQAGRVGRGHGGGRPAGSTDKGEAGRQDRVAEIYALLLTNPEKVTPEAVRRRYRVSTATAEALIRKAEDRRDHPGGRRARLIAEMLAGPLGANPGDVERELVRRWHISHARAAELVAEVVGQ